MIRFCMYFTDPLFLSNMLSHLSHSLELIILVYLTFYSFSFIIARTECPRNVLVTHNSIEQYTAIVTFYSHPNR